MSCALRFQSGMHARLGYAHGSVVSSVPPPLATHSINNVSHVGHAHPGVAAAVSTQLFTLNTNSRYLHEAYVEYAEAMAALCPAPLQASATVRGCLVCTAVHRCWAGLQLCWIAGCLYLRALHGPTLCLCLPSGACTPFPCLTQVLYMLTSGSEANDLAWRIARVAAAAANPDDCCPLHVAVVSWAAWSALWSVQRKAA